MSVCSDGSVGMYAAFLQIELLTDEPQIRWPGPRTASVVAVYRIFCCSTAWAALLGRAR